MKLISLKTRITLSENAKARNLCDLPAGDSGVISNLDGGKEFTARIAAMGLAPGALVTVVQNYGRCPVIVSVCNTRVALGRREASKILLESE